MNNQFNTISSSSRISNLETDLPRVQTLVSTKIDTRDFDEISLDDETTTVVSEEAMEEPKFLASQAELETEVSEVKSNSTFDEDATLIDGVITKLETLSTLTPEFELASAEEKSNDESIHRPYSKGVKSKSLLANIWKQIAPSGKERGQTGLEIPRSSSPSKGLKSYFRKEPRCLTIIPTGAHTKKELYTPEVQGERQRGFGCLKVTPTCTGPYSNKDLCTAEMRGERQRALCVPFRHAAKRSTFTSAVGEEEEDVDMASFITHIPRKPRPKQKKRSSKPCFDNLRANIVSRYIVDHFEDHDDEGLNRVKNFYNSKSSKAKALKKASWFHLQVMAETPELYMRENVWPGFRQESSGGFVRQIENDVRRLFFMTCINLREYYVNRQNAEVKLLKQQGLILDQSILDDEDHACSDSSQALCTSAQLQVDKKNIKPKVDT